MTLERQQELVSQLIEERTRTAVQRTTNSFPVIRLSRNGAESSAKNLAVVRDKYAQGIVNVTGPWYDAVYLSSDETLDAADTLLRTTHRHQADVFAYLTN